MLVVKIGGSRGIDLDAVCADVGALVKEANPNCTVLYVKVNFKADDALQDGLTSQQYLRILDQAIPGRRIRL